VRLNPPRSIGGETNLARRIEKERTKRGWSYETLAKMLTAAGCSIQGSGIYKIEKADPPRRITVDELLALAQVFDTTVEDLLTPIEVLERERAQELLKDLQQHDGELLRTIRRFFDAHSELLDLAAHDRELFDYVQNHHYRQVPDDGGHFALSGLVEVEARDKTHEFALRNAFGEVYLSLVKWADLYHQWNEQTARSSTDGQH
jgi:transcriptional regulator with XRE-family HTH domain